MRSVIMSRLALAFAVMLPLAAHAASEKVALDKVDIDIYDQPSLQRGVQLYTNYCMACHSLKYSRYERVADDIGIPHDLYLENLVFDDAKIGSLMENAMEPGLAQTWFGAAPPDLSLIARVRGGDWLYTYLRTFYKDESRPWGVNNAVFKDVGMPHVLAEMQGLCASKPATGVQSEVDPMSGEIVGGGGCENYVFEGEMTPAEFNSAMRDLTNFLVYVGEPSKLQANAIAPWVLLFLVILFIPVYLLNREYWKDIH